LPILIDLREPLRGDVEETLDIALVELDLCQIEETTGLVEWRILLRPPFADPAARMSATL